MLNKLKAWIGVLGPGLVTGASDDDPSGIGTYAQSGARFGYAPLWLALVTFPLMAGVQETCSRIAMQTGKGLAEVIRLRYSKPVLYGCVALLTVANTVNIGADLGAMASAGQMVAGGPFLAWLGVFTAVAATGIALIPYHRYASVLRLLSLSLMAYVVAVFVVRQDWRQVAFHTFVPSVSWRKAEILNIVAILGTTISPYLFFWQAGQEIEQMRDEGRQPPPRHQGVPEVELRWRRADVGAGMLVSNLIMWCVIVTTASTLHRSGVTDVGTAAQAAQALRPVAGPAASWAFALGIVGTGLLAVPVLAGSTAFAVAGALSLRKGLSLKLRQARGFYAVIVLSTITGAAMNFLGVPPMRALVASAVLNGIVAPPLLFMVLRIGGDRRIMRARASGRVSALLGWATFTVMTGAAVALLVSAVRP